MLSFSKDGALVSKFSTLVLSSSSLFFMVSFNQAWKQGKIYDFISNLC